MDMQNKYQKFLAYMIICMIVLSGSFLDWLIKKYQNIAQTIKGNNV
jgi:hypothetical protein